MTLAEATARFLAYARRNDSAVNPPAESSAHSQSLRLLADYFPLDPPLSEITPSILRDFLSRWYVERIGAPRKVDADAPNEPDRVIRTRDLLNSLAEFFNWTDKHSAADQTAQLLPLIFEFGSSLPRAIEITTELTSAIRDRGGAFTFPEFLTSFEEGGSSQYDIDVPGNIGAIDGYFRIVRVEGSSVEGEELLSGERVWPIAFPDNVAALLEAEYIINLELVRDRKGWRIAGCGFAYPPGTEVG